MLLGDFTGASFALMNLFLFDCSTQAYSSWNVVCSQSTGTFIVAYVLGSITTPSLIACFAPDFANCLRTSKVMKESNSA